MIRTAVISDSRLYRAQLYRAEDEFAHERGIIGFVLNNPSVADAERDDNTVKKAWRFVLSWGYGAMLFYNVNPYRSTDPKLARIPPADVLATNDQWLLQCMLLSKMTVCGWGDKANPDLVRRAVTVMHTRGPLYALRVTKQGNPQHPLYLPGALMPQLWNPEKWLH